MKCCLSDLRYKEVIDQSTGQVKALVGGRGEKTASKTLNRASWMTARSCRSLCPDKRSSAACSAATTTTSCRGGLSRGWVKISFSPRSRGSSRAADAKSARIISEHTQKMQKTGQILLHWPVFSGIIPEHYAREWMCDHVVSAWSGTEEAPGGSN